ncbi:hypothetical protein KAX02_05950, partial [candidate division WOR-3 bacterium]|nr:hypothetical protein [candidate division WOR-3 bacterium]
MKKRCILLMTGLLIVPLLVWGRKGYGNYASVPGLDVFEAEYPCPPDSIPDDSLPNPILSDHPEWVDLYWKAWHIAKTKIQYGTLQNGFVDEYMDEGFNANIFQWDDCFMMMFARYGYNVFPSIVTLHNFYRKQHDNGFICREIRELDGSDYWGETDPSATNPPLFAWAEWEHYRVTADTGRLDTVLQHLTDYYQWTKSNRTRANGLYWWSSLGSGMDNSPRMDGNPFSDHGRAWVDYSVQQALAAFYIAEIALLIGDAVTATQYENEYLDLKSTINEKMWDQGDGLYYDLNPDESFFKVKTPASFWTMLAGISDSAQTAALVAHLINPSEFWRLHLFPTLAADHPDYNPYGGYWLGSVWAPTNYEMIKGLQRCGYEDLAKLSSENHIENMSQVYIEHIPHTIWENYAPDYVRPGSQSRGDFVGWSGCGPIALLIENVLGFRVDGPNDSLFWRLRLSEEHGIERLRFGDNKVDITADERSWHTDSFDVYVTTNSSFTLVVDTKRDIYIMEVPEGSNYYIVVGTPRLQIIEPEDGAAVRDSIHIWGLCTASIDSIEIAVDGGFVGYAAISDTEWFYDWWAETGGEYRITATGIDGEGNRYPTEVNITVLTMDKGILLVDETWDGPGNPGNPTDEMVDAFYTNLFSGMEFDEWDVASQGILELSTIGRYSLVVWYADHFVQPLASEFVHSLAQYLEAGGKLWFVGWRPVLDIVGSGSYPYTFEEGDFLFDYLECDTAYESFSYEFIGASGLSGYPDIEVDSSKIPSSWNGMVYIDVFSGEDAVYSFQSLNGESEYQGRPCAIKYIDDNHKAIFFGFPLYFTNATQTLVSKVLEDLG